MKLGLNNHTILWSQSFLENRSQTVVVDGQKSTSVPVMSGVPQGSVLGFFYVISKSHSYQFERVQRSAARYVLNDYSPYSRVTAMLNLLKWQTLEQRRNQASLIMLYKISHNLVAVDHTHLIQSRNHNFIVPFSRTQYHSNSFFPHTIRL